VSHGVPDEGREDREQVGLVGIKETVTGNVKSRHVAISGMVPVGGWGLSTLKYLSEVST
jgi:hypothetical protein